MTRQLSSANRARKKGQRHAHGLPSLAGSGRCVEFAGFFHGLVGVALSGVFIGLLLLLFLLFGVLFLRLLVLLLLECIARLLLQLGLFGRRDGIASGRNLRLRTFQVRFSVGHVTFRIIAFRSLHIGIGLL